MTAPPVPVVDGVSQALNSDRQHPEFGSRRSSPLSDTGLLASTGREASPRTTLQSSCSLVDENGRTGRCPASTRPLVHPDFRFSPDGRQLAFTEQTGSGLLWIFDVERQTYRGSRTEAGRVAPMEPGRDGACW